MTGKSVEIEIAQSDTSVFNETLQSGFMVNVTNGVSIEDFLCDQLGIGSKYIKERIKTVFLDSRPVDDLQAALLMDGSKLTLSGGMPGLVGMTLGRGSPLASFRSTITYRADEGITHGDQACVSIKLFNIVMKDLGGTFLVHGINVKRADIASLVEKLRPGISIKLDGVSVEPQELGAELQAVDGWVRLSIVTGR